MRYFLVFLSKFGLHSALGFSTLDFIQLQFSVNRTWSSDPPFHTTDTAVSTSFINIGILKQMKGYFQNNVLFRLNNKINKSIGRNLQQSSRTNVIFTH